MGVVAVCEFGRLRLSQSKHRGLIHEAVQISPCLLHQSRYYVGPTDSLLAFRHDAPRRTPHW